MRERLRQAAMWLHLLFACAPGAADHDCDLSRPHVVAATSDFVVGALAAITDDGCVADRLASTSGDAVVRVAGDRVWTLDRTGSDLLRAYPFGDYGRPELEVVAERHGNAHDLVERDGQLFVSLYDSDAVAVLDPATGARVGSVDLSAHADADGLPEADRFVVHDGELWLALQRLDRQHGWSPAGEGRLVRIDTARWEVDAMVSVGTNPRVGPLDGAVGVLSGVFFSGDGAAERRDPVASGAPWLSEADLGLDFGVWTDTVLLGTGFAVGSSSVVLCAAGAEPAEVLRSDAWFVDAAPSGAGAWVAARPGWTGDGDAGLWHVDRDCVAEPIATPTALPLFALAVVP